MGQAHGTLNGDGGCPIIGMEIREVEDFDAVLGLTQMRAGQAVLDQDGAPALPACRIGGGAGA